MGGRGRGPCFLLRQGPVSTPTPPSPFVGSLARSLFRSLTPPLTPRQLYAKAKALDVVDNDVDYHYHGLKLTQPVIDPASMKRVHRAQLPGQDAERLVETLGKIAAIAKSRQEFARDLEDVSEQLRRSEFARERAESLAKARGVALMKCQEALSDAEEQQVQLSGLLRNALEQLGVGSPNASGMTVSRGAMNGHHAPTPHAQVYSNSRSSDHFRYVCA